jgi:hypothetical protein
LAAMRSSPASRKLFRACPQHNLFAGDRHEFDASVRGHGSHLRSISEIQERRQTGIQCTIGDQHKHQSLSFVSFRTSDLSKR